MKLSLIRVFDLLLACIGIIILSPIFIITAFLIKATSNGNIIFRQIRVGLKNKDFYVYKFRTMYSDSDKYGLLTVGSSDYRITKIGCYLRKYKIDELPQLFNVLIGNMSFVGPRPEVRHYVKLYSVDQQKILNVKPGITDKASIFFRNENEILAKAENPELTYINDIIPRKMELNFEYINHPTLINYFKIIVQTIRSIFIKKDF